MSKLLKSIHIAESAFDAFAERFFSHHPYLGFCTAFIGIPLFILAGVTMGTIVITLPLSFLLGWL